MQYQVNCKHCHRLFAITSQPGQTVKASCPYCATIATIATPFDGNHSAQANQNTTGYAQEAPFQPQHRPFRAPSSAHSGLGLKVVKVYILIMLILILGASALYWLFSTMSQ